MNLNKWFFAAGTFFIALSILFLLIYIQSAEVFIHYTYDYLSDGGQYLVSFNRTQMKFDSLYSILTLSSLFLGTTSIILGIMYPFKKSKQ